MNDIRFKGIRHNILNDAPFIGALLIAESCHRGCNDCINQHLKSDKLAIERSIESIIEEVKKNGLNRGIILAGLEWTEQIDDIIPLVESALKENLEVMLYTHHTEASLHDLLPSLYNYPVYIKFGAYLPEFASDGHFSFGVKLATTNQYIKYFGKK